VLAFSTSAFALNIAIFDTGFCSSQIKNIPSNVRILKTIDLTNSVHIDCSKRTVSGRLHGQMVLKTFLSSLNSSAKITITPFIVFDSKKSQSMSYWKRAFSNKLQRQFDLYIMAAGLPFKDDKIRIHVINDLNIFVSQGKYGRGITKEHKLWPQEMNTTLPNLFIIGAHYPVTKYDKGYPDKRAMYLKQASYYFPDRGENIDFTGSSYSVALAAAKAINLCYKQFRDLKTCLKKKSKKLDWDHPLKVRTF
jgi:hypothetical protein